MEILKVQNLTKTYGKGDVMVKALDDVSFSVSLRERIFQNLMKMHLQFSAAGR